MAIKIVVIILTSVLIGIGLGWVLTEIKYADHPYVDPHDYSHPYHPEYRAYMRKEREKDNDHSSTSS